MTHPDGTRCLMPPSALPPESQGETGEGVAKDRESIGDPHQHEHHNEQGEAQKGSPAGKRKDACQRYRERRRNRRRRYRAWMPYAQPAIELFFAGVVALFTARLFYVTNHQWEAMAEANRIANEATQANIISADAAKRAADAAVENNRAAQTANRAWVIPVTPNNIRIDGPVTLVEVALHNDGQSPAFNVTSRIDWAWRPEELPRWTLPGGPVIVPPDTPRGVLIYVGQRKTAAGEWAGGLTSEESAAVMGGARKLYVGGNVRYDDPFGKDRETQFCAQYHPKTQSFVFCADRRWTYIK